jgi:hypothetical protein
LLFKRPCEDPTQTTKITLSWIVAGPGILAGRRGDRMSEYLNSRGRRHYLPKMKENFEFPSGEKAPEKKDTTTPSAFGGHPSKGGEL